MPSDPKASSSSSSRPSSSSSSSKPSSSSSSSARPSSSSSSSKPSSSSGSGGSSSSSSSKPSSSGSGGSPPQPTPHISANAWMSFFLFCCLVLIILQGPLGLTGGSGLPWAPTLPVSGFGGSPWASVSGMGGIGGMPGCAGFVSGYVPWCQPQPAIVQPPTVQVQQLVQQPVPPNYCPYAGYAPQQPQLALGGQGGFVSPGGGAGWNWYANAANQVGVAQHQVYQAAPRRTVQYQRPGLQIQVGSGGGGGGGGHPGGADT